MKTAPTATQAATTPVSPTIDRAKLIMALKDREAYWIARSETACAYHAAEAYQSYYTRACTLGGIIAELEEGRLA